MFALPRRPLAVSALASPWALRALPLTLLCAGLIWASPAAAQPSATPPAAAPAAPAPAPEAGELRSPSDPPVASAPPVDPDPSVDASEPVIELVTMGVGSRIWERHGHIVLCVRYSDPRRDRCYNYGIGDFRHPVEMGMGFFRGLNSFWAGADSPADMLFIYRYTDRTIWSQPLPLTPEQKRKIIAKLELDIREENKFYSYDHFEDNCTTRVRDILNEATGGALAKMTETTDGRTYRDLARQGFFGMRIPLLLTDLAMGRSTDRVPTYYERMFLPDYMREAATKLWGVEPRVIYQRKGPPPLHDGPSGRVLLALGLLALTLPVVLAVRTGRLRRTALAVAVIPQFLLGVAFWTLAIISPLPYVHINETCLIFLPLDLLLLILPWPLARKYARARAVMLVLVAALLAVGVLKQPLWSVLLGPLVPALAVGFLPPRPTAEETATAKAKVGKLAAAR